MSEVRSARFSNRTSLAPHQRDHAGHAAAYGMPFGALAYTIAWPSVAHEIEASTRSLLVICIRLLPSRFTIQISVASTAPRTSAIERPSLLGLKSNTSATTRRSRPSAGAQAHSDPPRRNSSSAFSDAVPSLGGRGVLVGATAVGATVGSDVAVGSIVGSGRLVGGKTVGVAAGGSVATGSGICVGDAFGIAGVATGKGSTVAGSAGKLPHATTTTPIASMNNRCSRKRIVIMPELLFSYIDNPVIELHCSTHGFCRTDAVLKTM